SFARERDAQPRVELMLGLERSNPDEDEQEEDRSSVEREARAVALRLREMREARTQVWDEERQVMRPAEWSDMVVLLRAATDKAPSYAKEFDKAAVPLLTAGLGLYQSLEVKDLVNGLMLLDNPFQDGPLLAVLRSPLAGLSVEDLANIRLALRDAPFWTAL